MTNKEQTPSAQDIALYYRDIAVLKFHNDTTQVLCGKIFTSVFLTRQNDPFWTKVSYVQTNIKSKIGLGKIINYKFSVASIIDHDLKEFEDINYLEPQKVDPPSMF